MSDSITIALITAVGSIIGGFVATLPSIIKVLHPNSKRSTAIQIQKNKGRLVGIGALLGGISTFLIISIFQRPTPIDIMNKLSSWDPSFCDDKCSGSNGSSAIFTSLVPGKKNNAVEVLYDVKYQGWVLITKNLDPKTLSGTIGISFFYKGIGVPNTIELKLLLRYPGDAEDTAFGISLDGATDTGDNWKQIEALYDRDFKCWWPADLCQKHANTLDLTAIKRIDFAISNKLGNTPGLGRVAFDELMGIQP